MKNMLISAVLAIGLGSCADPGEKTTSYDLPAELKDCSIYYIVANEMVATSSILTVVRCPNSSTTAVAQGYKSSSKSVTTIDE